MATPLNRLKHAKSPYLLQHAKNPVAWCEWNDEALRRAREENKPILLSIGYSACHWCHVMAHESFEDQETATFMNQYFINIKVDREERPDLDKIYQLTHQLLNQRTGGWPLTVFLTPDKKIPFFSGTYFPKQRRYGIPAFIEVLKSIQQVFKNQPTEINQQNQQLLDTLQRLNKSTGEAIQITDAPVIKAQQQLAEMFDQRHGGYGTAPKFPQPMLLNFLINEESVHDHLDVTLKKMAEGGIYDQLSGGFFRYSVDARWEIPHFEKMLYDNGQLLSVYADAYRNDPNPLLEKIILETSEWTLRETYAQEGGFFSSLNADSEGEEGKYYRWSQEEIKNLLTKKECALVTQYFNLTLPPNFDGHWHLYVDSALETVANKLQLTLSEADQLLHSAVEKLLIQRQSRVSPTRDEKVLTAWNALMIKGLAKAGFVLGRNDFIKAAFEAIDFIRNKLWINDRLLASYKDDCAYLTGYVDDYAFLLDALIYMLQIQWRDEDFLFAQALANQLLDDYYDTSMGGFFFTAHEADNLLQRLKPLADESLPAGNALATIALQRLGHLTGNINYLTAAEKTIQFAYPQIKTFPVAHISFLTAVQEYLEPPLQVIFYGDLRLSEHWFDRIREQGLKRVFCYTIPYTAKQIPFQFSEPEIKRDGVTAYVCSGLSCSRPLHTLEELIMHMKEYSQQKG